METMITPKKPELTYSDLQKMKPMIKMLKSGRCVKSDLACEFFNSKRYSLAERNVRDMISKIADVFPVVALSGQKGYRIPSNDMTDWNSISDIFLQVLELQSRIEKLKRRCKPLTKRLSRFMKHHEIVSIGELSRQIELHKE